MKRIVIVREGEANIIMNVETFYKNIDNNENVKYDPDTKTLTVLKEEEVVDTTLPKFKEMKEVLSGVKQLPEEIKNLICKGAGELNTTNPIVRSIIYKEYMKRLKVIVTNKVTYKVEIREYKEDTILKQLGF